MDLIIDVPSLADYHALAATLRGSGFREDTSEGAPLCRFVVDEVITDIMPVSPAVFGFSNVWYESALHHVSTTSTGEGMIRHLDAPHFCATKLEAFASRADGDYYHHDIEDFIAIVDERTELIDEIGVSPNDVRTFLATTTRALLETPKFVESLRGHLSGDEIGDQRLPGLRTKLERIAGLTTPSKSPQASTSAAGPNSVSGRAAQAIANQRNSISAPQSVASGGFAPRAYASAPGARVQVQSSNLDWVEYDAQQEQLLIGFNNGRTYRYSRVPPAIYQGLLDAYSKGRYFHVWIRNRYAYSRLR